MGNLSSTTSRSLRSAACATLLLLATLAVFAKWSLSEMHSTADSFTPDVAVRGSGPLINEVDSDQTGTDTMEFVEIFDGGAGNTPLDGFVIVFFNGANDTSYAAFDLDGFSTDAGGYFVLGNAAVPGVDRVFANSVLQNGQDAVALFTGNATSFPNGTPVSTTAINDALVYDTGQADDPGLLILLNAGQPQVDENQLGTGATVSMQRCPNGSGGPRNTNTYAVLAPTPGAANTCGLAIVQLASGSYTDDESQSMTVTIARSGNVAGSSSVTLSTSGGNAAGGTCEAGDDYVSQNASINFAPTETTRTVNIPLCSDLAPDTGEGFNLTLSNPVNAVVGPQGAAVGIINDVASQFKRSDQIMINDGAVTSSDLVISGAPTVLSTIRVTLFDVSDDVADDLAVLLRSPSGQTAVLWADSGGPGQVGPSATVTFSDASAALLPDGRSIMTGTFKPTSWSPDPTVVPGGPSPPYAEGGPGGGRPDLMLNSVFAGQNVNGIWTLYVYDDDGGLSEHLAPGVIAGGWAIEALAPTVVSVSLAGRIMNAKGIGISGATIRLEGGDTAVPLVAISGSFGYYRFDGLTAGRTYLVTVNSRRYVFAVPSRSITVHESVSDADFIAEPLE